MKIITYKPVEIDIRPGDEVACTTMFGGRVSVKVNRLVEKNDKVYAVFSNSTWRPITTYNRTWSKVHA